MDDFEVSREIASTAAAQIEIWLYRILTVPGLKDLFGPTQH
ncbi:hypothetical protein [Candidatus Accumulibacter cognatus]|uniref:Uncharacterized protein n=1 Tax=Candidatus Accumulibacter cognatus TaxID=2954383 RepID=A0A080MKW5_9PROT|nr:hypothetical protein [Candidatus Accumulibacter cognatus]KFB78189.1 MAG: hypothetical protein AW06_000412 [Candidatus Accumulibacter cognatus]